MRKTEGIGLNVDPEVRRRARLLAASKDISLAELVRQGLMRLLDEAEREQAAILSAGQRKAIGERTAAALAHKKANGEHVGAPALGRRVEAGHLVADPEEAATVARIRELAAEGRTLRGIASALDAEGRRTKRGGRWAAETVRKVLARERVADHPAPTIVGFTLDEVRSL